MRIQERHAVQPLPIAVFVVDAAAVSAAPCQFVEAVDLFAAVCGAVVPGVSAYVEIVSAFRPDLVEAVAGGLRPGGHAVARVGGGGKNREQHTE
ncbi:hypothetical protein D3C87_1646770 [compost metagenome]